MDKKTLTPYFRNMTLTQVWNADFNYLRDMVGMPLSQLNLLIGLCRNAPSDMKSVYDFLGYSDPLARNTYGRDVIFGLENLQHHAEYVAFKLAKTGFDDGSAVALAVLHDIGKKYTFSDNDGSNEKFVGHAELSAFIARHWLKQTFGEKKLKEIVAVIYAHELPSNTWSTFRDSSKLSLFRRFSYARLLQFCDQDQEFAEHIVSLIDKFGTCDIEDINNSVMASRSLSTGYDLICNS